MTERMPGKIALVTGGATGLGRTIAQTFSQAGAPVIVADLDEAGAAETVSSIKAAGGNAHSIVTDVTSATAVEALFAQISANWGRIDYACNNAGIAELISSWLDLSDDKWQQVLTLNLTGVWLCMRTEIREMLKTGGGAIVNNASIFGLVGSPNNPALTASKHGVIGLTKSAAVAFAKQNVRINAVCPAVIESPWLDRLLSEHPEYKNPIVALHPMGRLGTASEVAEAVLWLCSDAASFITGQALAVDGAYVAW